MTQKHFLYLLIFAQLFSACSYKDSMESIEDIYTDVKIVKPNSQNYSKSSNTGSAPIIKEINYDSPEDVSEEKSVHLKKSGYIVESAFDDEVKLYVYTFIPDKTQEHIVFYSDQKFSYDSTVLLDVDILDNYLMNIKKHHISTFKSIQAKKKYIKHKKRNYNIREAIEEKINTF